MKIREEPVIRKVLSIIKMNKKLLKIVVGGAVFLFAAYLVVVEVQSYLGRQALHSTGLKRYELTEAFKLAEEKNRFVLANVSAIWCPTCRKLDREIFSREDVKKAISDQYIYMRIEYESKEGKAFCEKYNVNLFPTLLIMDHDENVVMHLPLTFDPDVFIDSLNDFIELSRVSQ